MGSRLTTTKVIELFKVFQGKNYSFLSTGSPTYWPTDENKIPGFQDFFITNGISTTYLDIQASYDLTSDNTAIISTINTTVTVRQQPPRLHNSQTNWKTHRKLVSNKANLAVKLKGREDVELATDYFTGVLQHAAKEASPARNPQRPTSHIPSEIKRLVVAKRKARSTWQRTHTPESRRLFNQASNKLKAALHMRNASFTNYISNLKRDDNSIWKPIKNKKKSQTSFPPICKYSIPPGPWAKSNKERADFFAEHLSEVFTPHNNYLDQDVERDLATNIQPPEHLKAFTLKELKKRN
jgi:hypothetical protein